MLKILADGHANVGCTWIWLGCRRKDIFIAVAVDIIRFQSYGLQDNVALLVLLHRKGMLLQHFLILICGQRHCARAHVALRQSMPKHTS